MAKIKYYGVKAGRNPGVYTDWPTCEAQVKGFSGAQYASFKTEDEARAFVNGTPVYNVPEPQPKVESALISQNTDPNHIDVFVDGSYNPATNEYGYGILMDDGESKRIMYGKGLCCYEGRNIEGEVHASEVALRTIMNEGKYTSVKIYFDYMGIGAWANRDWATNKDYTRAYANFVNAVRENGIAVNFEHVKGHTGVNGNEFVDKLAKIGCGIALTSSEKKFLEVLHDVPGYPSEDIPEAIEEYYESQDGSCEKEM